MQSVSMDKNSCLLVGLLLLVAPMAISCVNQSQICRDEHSWDNLDHFSEFGLVPNPIPCQPKHTAVIIYNYDDYVLVGNVLVKQRVAKRPTIDFPALQRGANYTALLVDVDATSSQESLLFLAVNSHEVTITTSDIVAPYLSPNPARNTGFHRYVWLLFKQYGFIDPGRLRSLSQNRKNFSIKQFAAAQNLTVPTAGNMFLTKY